LYRNALLAPATILKLGLDEESHAAFRAEYSAPAAASSFTRSRIFRDEG
jgi:hypothetical protein